MNTERKIALIIISLFILIILGSYFVLETFSEAFGTDCKKNRSWSFVNYKIIEYECLGWAGPKYYPLYLYKNGEKKAENGQKIDSCIIRFRIKTDLYLNMSLCNGKISELKPQKYKFNVGNIDSIILVENSLPEKKKKLSEKQVGYFIRDLNKSQVSDYREGNLYSIFSNYQYLIKVYENEKLVEFVTFNQLIANEKNWVYYLDYSSKNYMSRLWYE